jgi:hypothetical protein
LHSWQIPEYGQPLAASQEKQAGRIIPQIAADAVLSPDKPDWRERYGWAKALSTHGPVNEFMILTGFSR